MFEEPQAKRVRRDELFDSGRSDASSVSDEDMDVETRALLNEQIAKSLRLVLDEAPARKPAETKPALEANEANGQEDSADEFEFQLFSNSEPTTKVVLEDDNLGEGGLVRARPKSFYLATPLSEVQRLSYAAAAVTGDEILERAKARCWGLELPWKVIQATSTANCGSSSNSTEVSEGGSKGKGRPGKKKRVAMRTRARAAEEKAKLLNAKLVEKEEHIKDKKKRLNRAKKLRRRQKAREQKAGGGGAGGDASESDSSA